jgi:hypothetical protein
MNPLLKFVYNPMVMMSVFLHGLLLIMPLPAKPPAEPEKKVEPPKPEEAVKLSSISSLKIAPKPSASPLPPKPLVKPAVKALARPPVRPVSAARPLPPPAKPLPAVMPSPVAVAPSPVAPSPVAPVAANPAPSPVEPTVPLSQGQLQSSAVAGVGQASAAQFYSSFPEPAAFFTAESLQQADANLTDPIPVDGVTNMTRLELMDVAQAKAEVLPQMFPGATFTPIGTYGGGDVYEVRQANSVGYVVLVKEASLSKAAYIVEWNRDPNSAQAAAPGAAAAQ